MTVFSCSNFPDIEFMFKLPIINLLIFFILIHFSMLPTSCELSLLIFLNLRLFKIFPASEVSQGSLKHSELSTRRFCFLGVSSVAIALILIICLCAEETKLCSSELSLLASDRQYKLFKKFKILFANTILPFSTKCTPSLYNLSNVTLSLSK